MVPRERGFGIGGSCEPHAFEAPPHAVDADRRSRRTVKMGDSGISARRWFRDSFSGRAERCAQRSGSRSSSSSSGWALMCANRSQKLEQGRATLSQTEVMHRSLPPSVSCRDWPGLPILLVGRHTTDAASCAATSHRQWCSRGELCTRAHPAGATYYCWPSCWRESRMYDAVRELAPQRQAARAVRE